VDDKQDRRNHEQQVDESSGDVKREPRHDPNDKENKRQNQKNVAHILLMLQCRKIQQI
jgi:hypothetical protein